MAIDWELRDVFGNVHDRNGSRHVDTDGIV